MKRYLLDSNAVTSFINRREPLWTRILEARRQGARIGTCEPVVAELLYGIELSQSREANMKRLQQGLSRLICWPLDRRASAEY